MKFTITAGIEVRYKYTNSHKTKFYDVYLMSASEELIGELLINPREGKTFRNFNDSAFFKVLEKFLIENTTSLEK